MLASDVLRSAKELWARHARREGNPFEVGGQALTIIFWVICAIFLVGLWLTPILPMGDYNYHLALASALRRMASAGSIDRELYATNLITYNSGFYLLVAALSFVMPTEYAGLLVFSGYWVGLCLVVIALLRALNQPTERAFIVFPVFLAVPAAWGFVNHCVGTVIMLWALTRAIRRPRHGAPIRYDLITALLAVFGLLSHLMATAIGYALVLATLVVRTMADRASGIVSYRRTIREGLPFLPAVALGTGIYIYQQRFQSRYPDAHKDSYALDKAKGFFDIACDFFADGGDRRRLLIAVTIFCLCVLFRTVRRAEPYPTLRTWLFVTSLLIYLLMPSYWWHIAVLYQRLPMVVAIFFVMMLPRAHPLAEKVLALAVAVVGIQSATAYLKVRIAQRPDLQDLARVIDEAPPGRRIAVDVPHAKIEGQAWPWAGHLAPYYMTRKGIEAAVNYAGIPSNPVTYRSGAPAVAPDGVAQGAQRYSPSAAYAKRFDLVLVRTLENSPAPRLWGKEADKVDLVSHHGNWWLFDARRYFENR